MRSRHKPEPLRSRPCEPGSANVARVGRRPRWLHGATSSGFRSASRATSGNPRCLFGRSIVSDSGARTGWMACARVYASAIVRGSIRMTEHGRPPYPHIHQINVSNGGVPKYPLIEAKVTKQGVGGDRQKNLNVHGGPDRAVCLFSLELIERLQDEGHTIDPGSAGENLTLAGLEWEQLGPGALLNIGPE